MKKHLEWAVEYSKNIDNPILSIMYEEQVIGLEFRAGKYEKALSQNQIDDFSIAIANQLLKLPIWDYVFYHIFL